MAAAWDRGVIRGGGVSAPGTAAITLCELQQGLTLSVSRRADPPWWVAYGEWGAGFEFTGVSRRNSVHSKGLIYACPDAY